MIPEVGDIVIINPEFVKEYKEKVSDSPSFRRSYLKPLVVVKKQDSIFSEGGVAIMWSDLTGLAIFNDGTFGGNYYSGKIKSRWKTQVFLSVNEHLCRTCGEELKEVVLFSSTTKYCPICEG